MYSLHTIENEFLRVEVNPIGAELFSIFDKKDQREVLWQGNSDFWASRAPVLFPIVGALKNNTVYYEKQAYLMPKHGIIRRNDQLEIVEERTSRIKYRLTFNDYSLKVYPFKFEFEIAFLLQEQSLIIKHNVKNLDTAKMYFSIGGHPAFNCPFYASESYEDYGLEFETEETLNSHTLTLDGLISDDTVQISTDKKWLPLTKDLFKKDALIFMNIKSKQVALKPKTGGKGVVVRFNDFRDLGIWAKPGAPFVCIEPWLGYADKWNSDQLIEHKEGMLTLNPNEEFNASYSITLA